MATNNAVNTSLSGQTGTGTFVGSTSPTLVTPTLGAASATSVTFSSTTGIVGTTTNNNAAAGSVGEYISSVVAAISPVTLTSTVVANVTSISLTAGDWDVFGNVVISSGATGILYSYGWVSTTSATQPDGSLAAGMYIVPAVTAQMATPVPFARLSLSTTTTVYLSAVSSFTGTASACGGIYARRRR
jgi:hypothetical protein